MAFANSRRPLPLDVFYYTFFSVNKEDFIILFYFLFGLIDKTHIFRWQMLDTRPIRIPPYLTISGLNRRSIASKYCKGLILPK